MLPNVPTQARVVAQEEFDPSIDHPFNFDHHHNHNIIGINNKTGVVTRHHTPHPHHQQPLCSQLHQGFTSQSAATPS